MTPFTIRLFALMGIMGACAAFQPNLKWWGTTTGSQQRVPELSLPESSPDQECTVEDLLPILKESEQRLSRMDGYTAKFTKIERVDGELLEPQEIDLTLRHEPFSVYAKWETFEIGREVLYVEGENDGNLIAHPGGWKARLISSVELEPTSRRAMADTRHPITKIGMLNLIQELVANREDDLAQQREVHCRMIRDAEIDGHSATCIIVEFQNSSESPTYRKSILYLDQKTLFPIHIRNYGWMDQEIDALSREIDELTLIESYTYEEIDPTADLSAQTFSHKNSEYSFNR